MKSVAIGVWVKSGSRDESDSQAGITHFLEHMLFKGTETRSAKELARHVESQGGYLNAFTSTEYTCYVIRCVDTELDSTFPEEELEKEKKVVLEEMKMYKDSPDDVIFEEFSNMMFPEHPLGRPIIGFEPTVSGFTQEHLRTYTDARYQPHNILVSIAGHVDHQHAEQLVERYFSSAKSHTDASRELSKPHVDPIASKSLTKAIEQTHMILGRRGLAFNDDDRIKLLMVNTLLSGGMSARLHQNIREKHGYCYSIGAFAQSYIDTGVFGVYIGTDASYVDHVRDLLHQEFDQLKQERVSEDELHECKTNLKGKMLLAQESMSNRMMRLAKSYMYHDRFITLDELVDEIDAITAEDVLEFSQRFFQKDVFSECLLLPES
jgi:predicted Zn-dependent peptidase